MDLVIPPFPELARVMLNGDILLSHPIATELRWPVKDRLQATNHLVVDFEVPAIPRQIEPTVPSKQATDVGTMPPSLVPRSLPSEFQPEICLEIFDEMP